MQDIDNHDSCMPILVTSVIVSGLTLEAVNLLRLNDCTIVQASKEHSIISFPEGTTRQQLVTPTIVNEVRNRILFKSGFELREKVTGNRHQIFIERTYAQVYGASQAYGQAF